MQRVECEDHGVLKAECSVGYEVGIVECEVSCVLRT